MGAVPVLMIEKWIGILDSRHLELLTIRLSEVPRVYSSQVIIDAAILGDIDQCFHILWVSGRQLQRQVPPVEVPARSLFTQLLTNGQRLFG